MVSQQKTPLKFGILEIHFGTILRFWCLMTQELKLNIAQLLIHEYVLFGEMELLELVAN